MSIGIKWGECDKIAKLLVCKKQDVFYKLYDTLHQTGLLFDLLMKRPGAIEQAKQLECYKN